LGEVKPKPELAYFAIADISDHTSFLAGVVDTVAKVPAQPLDRGKWAKIESEGVVL